MKRMAVKSKRPFYRPIFSLIFSRVSLKPSDAGDSSTALAASRSASSSFTPFV